MSSFTDVLETAIQGAQSTKTEGDYVGNDGLLHCGKCGEPKETEQPMPEALWPRFGKTRKLPILCKCENEKAEQIKREEEERERTEATKAAREKCFPYPALQDMTFKTDDGKNAGISKLCRRFVDKFEEFKAAGAGLLMYGAVGSGKTFHAATIANGVIDRGYTALFTSISTLGARMTANYGSNKLEILQDICKYNLVILDDLGIERTTDAMNENVYQIVNALYSNKNTLIFTTNLDPGAMLAETDPNRQRIYSRIFEMCQPVEVKGTDRRREVSEQRAALYKSLID